MGAISAVFLDRDGVINENRFDHVKDWSEFTFLPGALDAIARLSRAGVRVFVITNQAIVNRGLVSKEVVDEINLRMVEAIRDRGGRIDGLSYCPHRPEEQCGCRKPMPGLLLDLARKHDVDLAHAAVVGDALTDIDAGQAAGCQTILVLTGRGSDQLSLAMRMGKNGFVVASDLVAVTDLLLRADRPAA